MLILDGAKLNKIPAKEYDGFKLLFCLATTVLLFSILLSIGIAIGYHIGIESHILRNVNQNYYNHMEKPNIPPMTLNRLSRSVIPTFYKLKLAFSRDSTSNNSWILPEYIGSVAIHLNVTEDTHEIELHSSSEIHILNITIITAKFGHSTGEVTAHASSIATKITLKLQNRLAKESNLTLQIEFRASLSKNIYGIFNGSRENSTSKSLVSMLQAENARLAFPCFDEIDLKVPWRIAIDHPANTTALSNQKAISLERLKDDSLRTEFETTMPMSTYLVSIAILSDFSKMCKTSKSNVELCIWHSNFNESLVQQFLTTTDRVSQLCEKFLGTIYDYDKYDMIIVDRYLSGGFEGWGLTTLRRDVLTSWKDNLITHEAIHQWIGNQVTASDWGEVWLNEGITTYLTAIMENMDTTDNGSFVFNHTGREERSLFLNKYYGMENVFNAMHGSVFNPVGGSLTGEYTLSPVVYGKPAAILYMLEGIIGRDKLWNVIKKLVVKHKYGTINTKYFLEELEDETAPEEYGMNLNIFMKTWLYQIGFPIVKVEGYNETHYSFTQMALPDTSFHNVTEQIWPIPLWYQYNNEDIKLKWMFGKQLFHPHGRQNDTLVLNPIFQGYYHIMVENDRKSPTEKTPSEGDRRTQMYNAEHKVVCEELKRMPDIKKFC